MHLLLLVEISGNMTVICCKYLLLFFKAQAGHLLTSDVLRFAESYAVEDNVTVWLELLGNLNSVSQLVLNTEFNDNFSRYVRNLVQPVSKKLGWEPVQGEGNVLNGYLG
jgi:hypothetical protein